MKISSGWVKGILGTVIGCAIIAVLFSQVNLHNFSTILERISLGRIGMVFIFYFASMFFRAIRWQKMLVSKTIRLPVIYAVTAVHNLMNHILPARTGELSYIFILRKTQSVSASQGVATLILARVFDILAMGVFFLVSMTFFWNRITVSPLKLFLVTSFSIPFFAVVFVVIFSRRGVQVIQNLFSKWGLLKWKVFLWFSNFLVKLAEELYQIRISGKLVSFALLTLLAWGTKFMGYYILIQSFIFSEPMTFWETVLGTTFSELASTLPIYGFLGLGTIEGGWTLGFMLLGFEKTQVIAGAFCFHFIMFSFAVILGVTGFFLLKKQK